MVSEMGKVFVKGPTESPDDLLAKESRLGQAFRVGGDIAEGAIEMTEPIDNFGAFARKPLRALRYLTQGKFRRQLSPTELAYQKLIAGREAQEQVGREEAIRQREEEMAENFRRLEALDAGDDRRIAPLPEVTGSRFSRAGRQQRKDSKQALADAQAQRLADYERLGAAQRLPLQQEATEAEEEEMYARNLKRVQEENIRAALRGQRQQGLTQAQIDPNIMRRISDAHLAGVRQFTDGLPVPDAEAPPAPAPSVEAPPLPGQPDIKAIAESGDLSQDNNDGKKEINRVEAMANEQNKTLGMNNEREVPNFLDIKDLPQDQESSLLTPTQLADINDERERQKGGEE